MAYLFVFIIIFFVIFLYFLIQLRNFVVKERDSESRILTQLSALSSEIKEKNGDDSETSDNSAFFDTTKSWGYPPEKQHVIKDVLHGEKAVKGWDYAIHIHAGTEQYLGTALFKSMEKRIASIPGIDKCLQKDKQLFLISSQTYSAEILIELFWREFLHAAEIAHIKDEEK